MAVTHKIYRGFYESLFNKEINLATDTLKVMLVKGGTGGYTPDQQAHRYKSSVSGEASGPGYVPGGVSLSKDNPVQVKTSGLTVSLDADDTAWPSSTISGQYLVIYDSTPGSDAQRPLISYVDFGETVSTTSGTFQSVWNSLGILSVTVA